MPHVRTVALVALAVFVAGFVVGCGSKVSKSNYDKINNGMTLSEVEGILGKGTDQAGGGIGGLSGKVVKWVDGDKTITVTFVNDKVTAKTQTGL